MGTLFEIVLFILYLSLFLPLFDTKTPLRRGLQFAIPFWQSQASDKHREKLAGLYVV